MIGRPQPQAVARCLPWCFRDPSCHSGSSRVLHFTSLSTFVILLLTTLLLLFAIYIVKKRVLASIDNVLPSNPKKVLVAPTVCSQGPDKENCKAVDDAVQASQWSTRSARQRKGQPDFLELQPGRKAAKAVCGPAGRALPQQRAADWEDDEWTADRPEDITAGSLPKNAARKASKKKTSTELSEKAAGKKGTGGAKTVVEKLVPKAGRSKPLQAEKGSGD